MWLRRVMRRARGLTASLAASSLVVAANVSGAYGQDQYPIAIDGAFTPQEYDDLRYAVENWNTALANRIVFVVQSGRFPARTLQGEEGVRQQGLVFYKIKSDHPMLQGPAFRSTLAMAVGPVRSGMVYVIYDRIPKRGLTGITMHEMGHSLGSGHLEKGLMEPRYNPRSQRCIDILTMHAVAAAQRKQFDRLDWCR